MNVDHDGTNGDIGANDDPLETVMIHWSYNGGNVDNNAIDDKYDNNGENAENNSIGDIGDIGTIVSHGVIGTDGIIEWRCLSHFTRAIHIAH